METYNDPPSVEVLERLVDGSLKKDLSKALRFWIILRSLYGEANDPVRIELTQNFTFQQWQNRFFNDKTIHVRDYKPQNHDPNCHCAKTIKEWLFDGKFDNRELEWVESFKARCHLSDLEANAILERGKPLCKDGKPHKHSLFDGHLFAVTGKTLEYEFKALAEMRFLLRKKKQYSLVAELPSRIPSKVETPKISFTDLASSLSLGFLLDKFNQKINGETRFYFEIEDIIPSKISDKVEDLHNQLLQIWQQKPVPPILLNYRSAKLFKEEFDLIVYPVCLYYYRRAPYLIAFGQFPGDETQINWYDYRIDHIISLKELNWDDVEFPELRAKCLSQKPPNLEQVRYLRSEALGFDFYEEAIEMFLWFNPYFYANYIEGTERASLFQEVKPSRLKKFINKDGNFTPSQRQSLLSRIDERSEDKYYRIKYRKNDNNVAMRLRAWGPNVEVILPYELRQRMTDDMAKTWKHYN
ncbi:MAG: TIGR03985 family CRISPR-associated protein [Cyanobacteriota bacterium]|nr:TIGR03985 family CRISPR-associated protein [Cyanobacteriota bacterium]